MVEQGGPGGIEFPPQPVRSSNAKLATAVVALVAVGAVIYLLAGRAGVVGPSPSPPAVSAAAVGTELPSAGSSLPSLDVATWVDFTSPRNGIEARFPPGWVVTAALGDSYYTRQGFAAPRIGHLHDPGPTQGAMDSAISPGGMAFFISSLWIPAGMSEAAWWNEYAGVDVCPGCTPGKVPGPSAACFPKLPSDYVPVTVDGQVGHEHGGLPSCSFFTEVVVLVGGRAYQLNAIVNVYHVTGQVFDQALFDAWLSTIHFDPSSADDTSPASPSPQPGTVSVTVGSHAAGFANVICQEPGNGQLSVRSGDLNEGEAFALVLRSDGTVSSLSGSLRGMISKVTQNPQGTRRADRSGTFSGTDAMSGADVSGTFAC